MFTVPRRSGAKPADAAYRLSQSGLSMNTPAKLKAALERHIDAEAHRRVEENLTRMLGELGIDSP
jgi:hypothetical protein